MGTPGDAASDLDLIQAVRDGDDAAFGVLFERHAAAVRRYAMRLSSPSDADDLVAEAYTRILDLIRRGHGPRDSFRSYLMVTVRAIHLNRVRQTSRLTLLGDNLQALDSEAVGFDPEKLCDVELVTQAFGTLPERWRSILWLTAVEGRQPTEVAKKLGMSPGSVRALSFRAREGLRRAFLIQHVRATEEEVCKQIISDLPAYAREALDATRSAAVEEHARTCRRCAAAAAEIRLVNTRLGAILGPLAPIALAMPRPHGASRPTKGTRSRLRSRMSSAVAVSATAGLAAAVVTVAAMVGGLAVNPQRGAATKQAAGGPHRSDPVGLTTPFTKSPAGTRRRPGRPAQPAEPAPINHHTGGDQTGRQTRRHTGHPTSHHTGGHHTSRHTSEHTGHPTSHRTGHPTSGHPTSGHHTSRHTSEHTGHPPNSGA